MNAKLEKLMITSGQSMYPFIKNNDIVMVESLKDCLKIGDIAVVPAEYIESKENMKFICHRVIKIKNNNGKIVYFMKGDNSASGLEGPISIERIRGRVSRIIRRDLSFDLNTPLMKRLNLFIAILSSKTPRFLMALRKLPDLFLEWPWLPQKLKTFLYKGRQPFLYNAEALLLLLAKNKLSLQDLNKAITIIREGLYWTKFCELTQQQGVTPLIYNSLKKIEEDVRLPQFVKEKLKSSYLFIVSRAAAQHKKITELLKLFANRNIPAAPLKGPVLSKRIYGYIEARGLCVDFDLLIEEKNKEEARKLLEEAGYFFDSYQEISRWQWQYNFSGPQGIIVDLHWDITMMRRSKERIEGLWKGARLAQEKDVGYYEFEEEELLLYLCAHIVNSDACRHLRYLCDINELVNRYGYLINWDSVVRKAGDWRVASSLYTALTLSKKLLNSRIPGGVLNKIKPCLIKRFFIGFFTNKKFVLRDSVRKRFMSIFLSYIFFELIEARSFPEYLDILKRVLFPPPGVLLNFKKEDSRFLYIRYIVRVFKGPFKLMKNIYK